MINHANMALELALGMVPEQKILDTYEITKPDLDALLLTPAFQRELRNAREVVSNEGLNAGFKLRCRALAEHSFSRLLSVIDDTDTDPKVLLDVFKTLTNLGEMTPPPAPRAAIGINEGVNVVFNLNGLVDNRQKEVELEMVNQQKVIDLSPCEPETPKNQSNNWW